MDLVSESTEKLEPLPAASGEITSGSGETGWLEEMTEKAERGSAEVQFSLGQYHFSVGSYSEALKYFQMAAEHRGSSQASYQLGVMFYDGLGCTADPARGFGYMLQVAQSQRKKDGNIIPSAQYNVGRAYFQGIGVQRSEEEAVRWWLQAAGGRDSDLSCIRAQNTLGMFYSRPANSDLEKAFYWHTEAAENGNAESMAALGQLYLQGGVKREDGETGLQWLRNSVEAGCVYGTGLLAQHYYTSKLFSKAAETAFKVSELDEPSVDNTLSGAGAAGQGLSLLDSKGVAMGCFILARCLQLGQAVSKSEHKAQAYFTKAKRFDKAVVAHLHSQLTHGQL